MTGAAISVSEQREKMMDFSVPFMYYTQDLIMKKPSSGIKAVDLLQFMTPFENLVWFCTLATLVITSVAVFVLNYYSPYGYKNENGEGTSDEFSFFNSVWFALACMLQQGGDNTPRSLSGRKKKCVHFSTFESLFRDKYCWFSVSLHSKWIKIKIKTVQ